MSVPDCRPPVTSGKTSPFLSILRVIEERVYNTIRDSNYVQFLLMNFSFFVRQVGGRGRTRLRGSRQHET